MVRYKLIDRHIGETLKHLAEKSPLDDITVQDILNAGEISRKTFYNHFHDKQEVVTWIFRTELAKALEGVCRPAEIKIRQKAGAGRYADLLFYPELFGEDPAAVFSNYLACVLDYLSNNRDFYINAFNSCSQNNLSDYLHELTYEYLLNDITRLAGNFPLSTAEKEVMARYFAHAHSGMLQFWIKNGMKRSPIDSDLGELIYPITPLCIQFFVSRIIDKHSELDHLPKQLTGYSA